jgi:hypothetical protein
VNAHLGVGADLVSARFSRNRIARETGGYKILPYAESGGDAGTLIVNEKGRVFLISAFAYPW